eukprot:TRINITY_DN4791_c0_g1_i1.p1 TRINITY_DN4791_c0_g1~~TRINITY_DN4791_c0_g1_i1.p1  ORF type:complete len:313 (-),score=105.76 TRINITY_DN4791_c0_g1_i1:640-1557(-)
MSGDEVEAVVSSSSGSSTTMNAENMMLLMLAENPNGLLDTQMKADKRMATFSVNDVANAINSLIGKNRLELMQSASGILAYKLISEQDAVRLAGLNREQKLVYRVIEKAGNKGLALRDVKTQTNLSREVDKVLKSLLAKELIKCEKHHRTSKKMYLLFDVTPDADIVGGSWYSGAEFDLEFIEALQRVAVQFFRKNGKGSLDELAKFIMDSGISKIELSLKDVQTLVNSLVFDGVIEKAPEIGSTRDLGRRKALTLFRPTKPSVMDEKDPFVSIPCSICPITPDCIEGTEISPATCEYFRMWLEF